MSPFDQIEALNNELRSSKILDEDQLEQFRLRFLGSKNILKPLFSLIKQVPPEEKKAFGQALNQVKVLAESVYQDAKSELATLESSSTFDQDVTLPGYPTSVGGRHPVNAGINEIVDIFERIGFHVETDREIEDEWHNFTALNTPENHPARDMTDTYYLRDRDGLLRSQTSTVQIRVMEKQEPPIRIISPGRVFRNETVSARSHCQFHQIEGLYIDKGVSFADLKKTLIYYAKSMYGKDVKTRLRPSYFPFTEPSAEMDVYWGLETEDDYRITKGTGWLEVMGCGMVDPNVLKACNIDPEVYSGFAFGMGIERQVMFKHKINDIRLFYENDMRFLNQFVSD